MKAKPFNILLFLALAIKAQGTLFATEEMEVDSEKALYDGKTVALMGSVHLEHEVGSIFADEVVLHPPKEGKKGKLGCIKMDKNVRFIIKGGGELRCSLAELDREAMVAKYYSHDGEYVTYSESLKAKQNSPCSLFVKAKKMDMTIKKDADKKSAIDKIMAFEEVCIDYNGDFSLNADASTYQRHSLQSDDSPLVKKLSGTIHLMMDTLGKKCTAYNKNGDSIFADTITISINTRTIAFNNPQGELIALIEKKPITFSSQKMVWDLKGKVLKLSKQVKVDQSFIGNFKSDKDVHIYYTELKGKKELSAIESCGHTSLFYRDPNKKSSHRLNSYGKVFVDHKKMETTAESLWDVQGKALTGSQVHFQGTLGEMKADKLKIFYKMHEGKMTPKKVLLEGHVAMLNNKGAKGADKTLHYALADKVEYYPDKEEVYFSSHTVETGKKRRVLFYDKVNQVQISAPALKIKKDGASKKELIQGIGDVRLSFLESEFTQIKKHFNIAK